jgi:acyl phosphate:glycerol-3-phosphate acyltransferase
MTELPIKALLSYLLGSIVGSLLIGGFRGVDIRSMGSGNAGATNALRIQGKKVALLVLVIDLGKGWLATGAIAPWTLPFVPPAAPDWLIWSAPLCGIAVMLGHVYPLWYGFRGGKGVATFVGAVLGIAAWLVIPLMLTWLAAVILFGFVGLASILAVIAVGIAIAVSQMSPREPLLTFAILSTFLILYTHRGNIARMRAGTESRARRLWLLGTRRGAT